MLYGRKCRKLPDLSCRTRVADMKRNGKEKLADNGQ